jgi:hypothetical protein
MRLQFELDPAIIHHIIYSQAGSIGKAIIELIMNCVDASAKTVTLSMTKEGFSCSDDGTGFATREDVLRYFGRFGTPHQEGDATYGRFRLGRGQVMAHASTVWRSREWMMTVDTRTMGYGYDLDDLAPEKAVQGCEIEGRWYDALTDTELLSATQEIRDLVRYTPVRVELNGRPITRDPRTEKWDHEDEFAWYRVKVEGAVSIYNQGVLVRNDAPQEWGAGGLIVSKKAISLNVSRTEILRKTCPVWKPIAKQFGAMARELSARLGEHRKTEARREKAAHDLLAGNEDILRIFGREEVITLLPGKRHVSLFNFLDLNRRVHDGQVSVVDNAFDVPKGEAIARAKIAQVVDPSTLARFHCDNAEDFSDTLGRILQTVSEVWETTPDVKRHESRIWGIDRIKVPEFINFGTLREAFVERAVIVSENTALDRETRRMWTALRWCVEQYVGLCAGGRKSRHGDHRLASSEHRKHILLGESNTMEAWTDGDAYIALNVEVIKRLKSDPIKTAGYVFSLAEHEVAHDGDSIDCGHDEAFYRRYHDISIAMAHERQRYLHIFLKKYVYSMEGEGRRHGGSIWYEQRLIERANTAREKREMAPVIEDLSLHPLVTSHVVPEDADLITTINAALVERGACPPPPDWDEIRTQAREAQARLNESWQEAVKERAAYEEECARTIEEHDREERTRIAAILNVAIDDIHPLAWPWLLDLDEDQIHYVWTDQPWKDECEDAPGFPEMDMDDWLDHVPSPEEMEAEIRAADEEANDPANRLDAHHLKHVQPGETWWSLERNAAAAGYFRVEDYLVWRAGISA